MIELPEAIVLGQQINDALAGKTVKNVFDATSINKFVFFNGDPLAYGKLLSGRRIISAKGSGIFADIRFDNEITLSICDGIKPLYGTDISSAPQKYQLLMVFDDNSFLAFGVAMYGGLFAYRGKLENDYHEKSFNRVSPISGNFTRDYFEDCLETEKGILTLKAFLATGQRFPGIGNGVLQDILFKAGLHPKRRLGGLTGKEKDELYNSVVNVLSEMVAKGGRDTNVDLFGNKGGYRTILSKDTYSKPCPRCGGKMEKENHMGGSIYYCPCCQPLK